MNNQRIYADLNKWEEVNGEFRVTLTTRGTHEDLQRYGITLKEGQELDFWMDDGDASGSPDPLYFEGVTHYDEAAQCWTAAVNRNDIRNASESKVATGNAPITLRPDSITHVESPELEFLRESNTAEKRPIKL